MIRSLSNYARRVALGAIAALALIAVSAPVNKAHACSDGVCVSELGTGKSVIDAAVVSAVMGTIAFEWGNFVFGSVYRDIKAGGLNRKYSEVVPGAGYRTSLAARLENNSELRAQMASWQVAEQYASAAR